MVKNCTYREGFKLLYVVHVVRQETRHADRWVKESKKWLSVQGKKGWHITDTLIF
jgi:hypothetical protein